MNALAKALKAGGVRGELLSIRAKQGFDFITNDLVSTGTSITENGFHMAIRAQNMVFDNFFRGGVPYETYVNALNAPAGVSITAAPF